MNSFIFCCEIYSTNVRFERTCNDLLKAYLKYRRLHWLLFKEQLTRGEFRYIINKISINNFNCKEILHALTFWVTSSEGLGWSQTVFRPRVNPFNDLFATKVDIKTNFSAGDQSDFRERNLGLISY